MVPTCPPACQAQGSLKQTWTSWLTCWLPRGKAQPHGLQGTGPHISAFPADPAEPTLSTVAREAVMGARVLQREITKCPADFHGFPGPVLLWAPCISPCPHPLGHKSLIQEAVHRHVSYECTCVRVRMCAREVDAGSLPLSLSNVCFETRSDIEPRTHRFGYTCSH